MADVDLSTRLYDFYNSLSEVDRSHCPSWQTGEIFNVLLEQAKQELSDDPVVSAISPAQQKFVRPGTPICDTDVGTLRAVVQQILSAMGQSGPAIG